jgi:hypothetical protein
MASGSGATSTGRPTSARPTGSVWGRREGVGGLDHPDVVHQDPHGGGRERRDVELDGGGAPLLAAVGERGDVDHRDLPTVALDAEAGRDRRPPVGHDLERQAAHVHRCGRLELHPLPGLLAEGRAPRGGRVAVEGRRGPRPHVPDDALRGPRHRTGPADGLVEDGVAGARCEVGGARHRERAPGGQLEGAGQRQLLVGAEQLAGVRAGPREEDGEVVVRGRVACLGEQRAGQTDHLVDGHVADLDLGEAGAAQALEVAALDVVGGDEHLEGAERGLVEGHDLPRPLRDSSPSSKVPADRPSTRISTAVIQRFLGPVSGCVRRTCPVVTGSSVSTRSRCPITWPKAPTRHTVVGSPSRAFAARSSLA